jgi:hypothetical protein
MMLRQAYETSGKNSKALKLPVLKKAETKIYEVYILRARTWFYDNQGKFLRT